MATNSTYFDEAYFQRGSERGTAYVDYAKTAAESPTFREVARAICEVFRPRRCLEIGCATGAIVSHMNELGVETHGIDVSEWAVANRLHPNVQLAGADALPFGDGEFDLVFSSHSLEHLPPNIVDVALSDINRVLSDSGYQFHMLPIIGTYPYDYDREAARAALKTDPTHNILEDMGWWASKWADYGWKRLDMNLQFAHDTGIGELSAGQYTLGRNVEPGEMFARAFAWNQIVHRTQFLELRKYHELQKRPVAVDGTFDSAASYGPSDAIWGDIERAFHSPLSFADSSVTLVVELVAPEPVNIRLAMVDQSQGDELGVLEYWIEAKPGIWSVRIDSSEFVHLSGRPSLTSISKIFLGGAIPNCRLQAMACLNREGRDSIRLF